MRLLGLTTFATMALPMRPPFISGSTRCTRSLQTTKAQSRGRMSPFFGGDVSMLIQAYLGSEAEYTKLQRNTDLSTVKAKAQKTFQNISTRRIHTWHISECVDIVYMFQYSKFSL